MDARISDITRKTVPSTENFKVKIKNEGTSCWLIFDTEHFKELQELMTVALNAGVKWQQWSKEKSKFEVVTQ